MAQNERDVLEALGEYKCDVGISVENVIVMVNIKTLKGRFIVHKVSTWVVGVVKSVWKRRRVLLASLQSSIRRKRILLDSKTKQGRLRGRQVLGTSCCCKRVNTVEKQ